MSSKNVTNVGISRLSDDTYKQLKNTLVYQKIKSGISSVEYYQQYNKYGKNVFNKYYKSGKKFIDKYPDLFTEHLSVDNTELLKYLKVITNNNSITVIKSKYVNMVDGVSLFTRSTLMNPATANNFEYTYPDYSPIVPEQYTYYGYYLLQDLISNYYNNLIKLNGLGTRIINTAVYNLDNNTINITFNNDNTIYTYEVSVYGHTDYIEIWHEHSSLDGHGSYDYWYTSESVSTGDIPPFEETTETDLETNETTVTSIPAIRFKLHCSTSPVQDIYVDTPYSYNDKFIYVLYKDTSKHIKLIVGIKVTPTRYYDSDSDSYITRSKPEYYKEYNNQKYYLLTWNNPNKELEIYPILTLRHMHQDIATVQGNPTDYETDDYTSYLNNERYKTTNKCLRLMNYDLKKLTDKYTENNGMDKIFNVFFLLGINPNDIYEKGDDDKYLLDDNDNKIENKVIVKYFYLLWDYLYNLYSDTSNIELTFSERPYHLYFPISITRSISNETSKNTKYKLDSIRWINNEDTFTFGGNHGTGNFMHVSKSDKYGTISYSVANTGTVYSQVAGWFTYLNGQIYDGHTNYHYLYDSIEVDNFVLPLIRNVVAKLSTKEQVQLLGFSEYLIFFDSHREKVPWYATREFTIARIVVEVFIIVSTWGTASPAVAATEVAINAATQIIINLLIAIAVTIVLKIIEVAFKNNPILRIGLSIAVIVLACYAVPGGGIGTSDSIFQNSLQIGQLAVQAGDITANAISDYRLGILNNSMESFRNVAEEKFDELSKIQKQLESGFLSAGALYNAQTSSGSVENNWYIPRVWLPDSLYMLTFAIQNHYTICQIPSTTFYHDVAQSIIIGE